MALKRTELLILVNLLVVAVAEEIQASSNCPPCTKVEKKEYKSWLSQYCDKKNGRLSVINDTCCTGSCTKFPGEWCGRQNNENKICGPALYCMNNVTTEKDITIKRKHHGNRCVPAYTLHRDLSFCPPRHYLLNQKYYCRAIANYMKLNFTVSDSANLPTGCWKLSDGNVVYSFDNKPGLNNTTTATSKMADANLICINNVPKNDLDEFNWEHYKWKVLLKNLVICLL